MNPTDLRSDHPEPSSGPATPSRPVRRRAIAAAVALLLAAGVVACGSDGDSGGSGSDTSPAPSVATTARSGPAPTGPGTPEPRPLAERTSVTVVSTGPAEGYAAMYLADMFGEFEKENLDVEVVQLPLTDALPGLIAGQYGMVVAGFNAGPLNAVASGADLAWVAATYAPSPQSKAGIWVRSELFPPSGDLDLCTLEGKTISFGAPFGLGGTPAWWFGDVLLEDCGLGFDGWEISTLAGGDMVTALQTGSIDGAFLYDPLWAAAEAEGYARLVVPQPDFPLGGYIMGPARHQEPEVADALVRAMIRTSRTYLQGDYRQDPEVMSALVEGLGIPEQLLQVGGSGIFPPDMVMVSDSAEPLQAAWIRAGGILNYDEPIPADELVDDSIVERVLAGG